MTIILAFFCSDKIVIVIIGTLSLSSSSLLLLVIHCCVGNNTRLRRMTIQTYSEGEGRRPPPTRWRSDLKTAEGTGLFLY